MKARFGIAIALLAAACGSANGGASQFDGGAGGSGDDTSSGGGSGAPSLGPASDAGSSDGASNEPAVLTAIVRDFRLYNASDSTTDPDFENVPKTDQNGNPDPNYTGPWDDRGVVADMLGADGKPVYAHDGATTLTTHGRAAFDMWFRDTPGSNDHVEVPIALTTGSDGSTGYDSEVSGVALSANDPTKMFFPIDDGTKYATPFGDQGDPHNYSFTVEMHTRFTYKGGEFFRYRGDDDVWVFVNGKRVIDIGGIHGPEEAQVSVDSLGLTKGTEYPLDFFFAERHKTGSNVLFETSLDLRPAPPVK